MNLLRLVMGVLCLGSAVAAAPQDKKKGQNPDPVQVDAAIKKGVDFLRSFKGVFPDNKYAKAGSFCVDELVLWTLAHAGVPEEDPYFQQLLKPILEAELQNTYCTSFQAMVLEEVERVKHQRRILQCAQFLVDNQCKNGQWTYGEPTPFAADIPAPKDVATGKKPATSKKAPKGKPEVRVKMPILKKRPGKDEGDNSNSQYAALGLRACHEAGAVLPAEVLELAMKWWRGNQLAATGKEAYPGAGWGYGNTDAYGSMTAGAVGALVIYNHLKSGPLTWMRDKDVQEGMQWMAANFSVTANPLHKEPKKHLHYYLYALERVGMLYGTEKFGGHEWYPAGAKALLAAQKPDGSWAESVEATPVVDTCFAILFLRRATRPLVDVASVDRFAPKREPEK